ncbi:MAG: group 1 truncated hemoglobin [Verrucomicrobiota bacterium]
MKNENAIQPPAKFRVNQFSVSLLLLILASALTVFSGCGSGKAKKKSNEFFTSGNREADQRASQRMAKAEQLNGSGEGAGEKNSKKAKAEKSGDGTNSAAQVEGKLSLFDRLGGQAGIEKIVEDFVPRALQDPRVNWQRKGVKRGGFSLNRADSVSWNATPEKVALLEKHFVQFFALATGGPVHYEGKEMKSAHAEMHISNPEFDAAVGDLKASLDKLQIPNKEQKELLSVAESTRPLIVVDR